MLVAVMVIRWVVAAAHVVQPIAGVVEWDMLTVAAVAATAMMATVAMTLAAARAMAVARAVC